MDIERFRQIVARVKAALERSHRALEKSRQRIEESEGLTRDGNTAATGRKVPDRR
jgi:hypothetical protein